MTNMEKVGLLLMIGMAPLLAPAFEKNNIYLLLLLGTVWAIGCGFFLIGEED